jgi:hypothetical protein
MPSYKLVFPPGAAFREWSPSIKALAIFASVGPIVFAAGVTLILYAINPATFEGHREGCEFIEGEGPFIAVFSTFVGFIPSLLGAAAYHLARARDMARASMAPLASLAIFALCALACAAFGTIFEGRMPFEALAAFCPSILVSTCACWLLSAKFAITRAPSVATAPVST